MDDEQDWSYAHGDPDEVLESPERMLEYALLGLPGYATAATMLGEALRELEEHRRGRLVAVLRHYVESSDEPDAVLVWALARAEEPAP